MSLLPAAGSKQSINDVVAHSNQVTLYTLDLIFHHHSRPEVTITNNFALLTNDTSLAIMCALGLTSKGHVRAKVIPPNACFDHVYCKPHKIMRDLCLTCEGHQMSKCSLSFSTFSYR